MSHMYGQMTTMKMSRHDGKTRRIGSFRCQITTLGAMTRVARNVRGGHRKSSVEKHYQLFKFCILFPQRLLC